MGDGLAILLGGKPKGGDDKPPMGAHAEHDDAPEGDVNHEFNAAAGDAFHALHADDLEGFRKALYNAFCAVRDEDSDEGEDEGDEHEDY